MAEIDKNMMGFDDAIEDDGLAENPVLPEGDYKFTVTNFERGRFPGGTKIPECNKAMLTLQVEHEGQVSTVRCDLILYRTVEWKLSAFFRSIGLKKPGEKLVMDWSKVVGARGRAHFKPRTYKNSAGEERTVNDLDRFLDYDPLEMDDLPF